MQKHLNPMTNKEATNTPSSQKEEFASNEYQGIYGKYTITLSDEIEVRRYRLSVLFCGISFCAGITHWLLFGPNNAWVWLILMAISLGLALNWIHIYLRPLHLALKFLWAIGTIGIIILLWKLSPENLLPTIARNPIWIIPIGPLFAALTGLGFKEFFCFRRIEAIGLTILVPISLLGYLVGLTSNTLTLSFLLCSACLLLILSLRKFGVNPASDIGDKSVFEYLEKERSEIVL